MGERDAARAGSDGDGRGRGAAADAAELAVLEAARGRSAPFATLALLVDGSTPEFTGRMETLFDERPVTKM